MKILAVDTATATASVAIVEGETVLKHIQINNTLTHSQNLMPMIDEAFKSLDLKPNDIDVFAASIGPGSFTGLRIGVTTIKAIAASVYNSNCPNVSAVNTLDALARNIAAAKGVICSIINARNNQVFGAVYLAGTYERLSEYAAEDINLFIDRVKATYPNKIFLVGDAAFMHLEVFRGNFPNIVEIPDENLVNNSAVSVAKIALEQANSNKLSSYVELVPNYLRKSQAERLKNGQ